MVVFWSVAAALILGVAGLIARPMLFGAGPAAAVSDVDIYKAQLAEVDRDLARGVLDAGEAETARAEVARRLLAARNVQGGSGSAGITPKVGLFTIVAVLAVTVVTYQAIGAPGEPDLPLDLRIANAAELRANRPSQAALEAAAPPLPAVSAPEEYLDSVAQLRSLVPARPDDLRGWQLLTFHETELRNYAAAAKAQAQVNAILGGDVTPDELVRQVDLMVAATNGYVSPEAEDLLNRIRDQDAANVAVQYYMGSLFEQTGRPDVAFRAWRPLVENAPDSFHTALARAQIADAAARAGVEYEAPVLRGPSLEDINAAQDMTDEDRAAMIGNMVAGLSERLATQGGPPADWARLIRAFGVLGDTESAGKIWAEAQAVFGADPAAMDRLRTAAQEAGIVE